MSKHKLSLMSATWKLKVFIIFNISSEKFIKSWEGYLRLSGSAELIISFLRFYSIFSVSSILKAFSCSKLMKKNHEFYLISLENNFSPFLENETFEFNLRKSWDNKLQNFWTSTYSDSHLLFIEKIFMHSNRDNKDKILWWFLSCKLLVCVGVLSVFLKHFLFTKTKTIINSWLSH